MKSLENVVVSILKTIPICRDSDDLLYLHVCKQMGLNTDVTLEWFLKNGSQEFPNRESVCRIRRRAQETIPELCGDIKVRHNRVKAMHEYYNYSKTQIKLV